MITLKIKNKYFEFVLEETHFTKVSTVQTTVTVVSLKAN